MQNNPAISKAGKAPAVRLSSKKPKQTKERIEKAVQLVFTVFGLVSVACVLLISVYLIVSGIPAITKVGLIPFITGTTWAPNAPEPEFGILPFILSSIYGMAGALVLGVPLGLFCALYISRAASEPVRRMLMRMISVLAGIPSVVYGLVGMLVIVPTVRNLFSLSDGACLLSAILVLSVMILPTVISMSVNALDSVSREEEEASLALGATKEETMMKVILPSASSGIAAAVVLGAGRAIGEAMAVIMVAGNAAHMPSLFESVRFLTTAVSSEMSYASGLQLQALFSIALVLFVFIMMINALLNLILKRGKSV